METITVLQENINKMNWDSLEKYETLPTRTETLEIFNLLNRDPSLTLAKIRNILERIVNFIYDQLFQPSTLTFGEQLHRLNNEKIFPKLIYVSLNSLRLAGNVGAHEIADSKKQVSALIPLFLEVMRWFIEEVIGQLIENKYPNIAEPEEIRLYEDLGVYSSEYTALEDLGRLCKIPLPIIHSKSLIEGQIGVYVERGHIISLSLYGENLGEIPDAVRKFQSLQFLNLRKNHLVNLPFWIFELKNLKHLQIQDNKFLELPEDLLNASQQLTIQLDTNLLKSPKARMLENRDRISINRPYKLKLFITLLVVFIIGIVGQGIFFNIYVYTPENDPLNDTLLNLIVFFWMLYAFSLGPMLALIVYSLFQTHNKIKKRYQFGSVQKLFVLSYEELAAIQSVEKQLREKVPIKYQISKKGVVPPDWGYSVEHDHIVFLSLKDRNLLSVPNCIRGLKYLKVLDLQHNKIELIPDWISELVELRELNISKNPIQNLPKNITDLPDLKTIFFPFTLKKPKNLTALAQKGIDVLRVGRLIYFLPLLLLGLSLLYMFWDPLAYSEDIWFYADLYILFPIMTSMFFMVFGFALFKFSTKGKTNLRPKEKRNAILMVIITIIIGCVIGMLLP